MGACESCQKASNISYPNYPNASKATSIDNIFNSYLSNRNITQMHQTVRRDSLTLSPTAKHQRSRNKEIELLIVVVGLNPCEFTLKIKLQTTLANMRKQIGLKGNFSFFEDIDKNNQISEKTMKIKDMIRQREGKQVIYIYSGQIKINNGNYEGELKGGLRDGFGIFQYQNGNRYEGSWKQNMRNGYGILYQANGERYEGEWRNGKKQGKGKIFYYNGDVMKGIFREGKITDKAILYNINDKINVSSANESNLASIKN